MNQSLISPLTAEEKIEKVREGLRNPQLKVLAEYVKHRKTETFVPSNVSPSSRRKIMQS